MTFRLLVTGGQHYDETAHIRATLDRIHAKRPITVLIHGNAGMVDREAASWAEAHEIEGRGYPANHAKSGRKAIGIRDAAMFTDGQPDGVAAFHGASVAILGLAQAAGVKIMWIKPTDDYELQVLAEGVLGGEMRTLGSG